MKNPHLRQHQQQLLQAVAAGVTPHGFTPQPKEQSFVRPFPEGRQEFHLGFIEHEADFDVTADVAIRFERLEELVNADNKLLSKKEKAATASLGIELGNLVQGAQFRWTVAGEPDVAKVAASLIEWFAQHALPYFERYSDLAAAYDLLAPADRSAWGHHPLHGSRAKRVLGLAALLGRDDLQAVAARQEQYLQELKDFGLADFKRFADRVLQRG
ncbi:MAG: hypothetical protein QHC78_09010 [Pigmentiphaga sp.]|uniref:hypothetical protein n=1 Tax=Pigmentiphaga sp. TaxID=1977564 RepID=UPI0029BEE2AB|nr:hypothetical protein [Pigmentiphaga sp.]MDX3905813.1 hypothetical protein [Pigmentiphaga sp.]